MPRVPTYDNFQAQPGVSPNAPIRAPQMYDVAGRQGAALSDALGRAGQQFGAIAQDQADRANQARVDDAMNQLVKARTDYQVEATKLRGKDALERPDNKSLADEYTEKLDEHARTLAQGLGNDTQRQAFMRQSGALRSQFYGALSSHMVQQQNEYEDETGKATREVARNQATLLWGDATIRKQSTDTITISVDAEAKRKGWSPEQREAALVGEMTPMHAGIINGLIKAGQATEARKYMDENSAQMTPQARAAIQGAVMQAEHSQIADEAVSVAWNELGPRFTNDAVRLYDLDQRVRELLKDKPPEVQKLATTGMRERAQTFNAQQSELNAKAVNGVFALIDNGTPLGAVRRSDEWMALPEVKRHEISRALEAEANVRAQRAAAASSRELTELQRRDKLALLENGDAYLMYSDPAKLSTMTRNEVAALRTTFGLEGVQHLLGRWDNLQKQENKVEARVDQDTFNQVAEEMGLEPFKPTKSKSEREALGALKYRVETLIDTAQRKKGGALTRSEKEDLIRGEMSRTVTVDTWGWNNAEVPVVALSPQQARNVMIPAGDRSQIEAALAAMRAQQPNNPLYAPTEENVRRLYLTSKSRAGALINGK